MSKQKNLKVEQADAHWKRHRSGYHAYLSRRKNRVERQEAKRDPECQPCYGRYRGYES